MGANLRFLLLAGAFLSTAACSASVETPGGSPLSDGFAPAAFSPPPATMRVALALPLESGEGAVGRDQLRGDEAAMPDIAGRWTGAWSGIGAMSRRVSTARAEFSQAGRWGWGKIVLSDAVAAHVPAIVTNRGALGVPVIFDVFPARVVMKHEAGGAYLSAVFRVDGDRMLGTLRGYDTLIVLSRER
ncbi:MAG: hypothetical protein DMD87_18490 [Candidatus Rokuibacteriota bacterium]|nr:MAG: hypothetical protein DMD87_18490 [Candidatus Rokubacteria bacterium]